MIFVKFLVILHFESDNNMLERNKIEYLVIFIGEFARHFNLGIQQTYIIAKDTEEIWHDIVSRHIFGL